MPPSVEHLYVLTLALEEALKQEQWQEAEALFGARGRRIADLERAVLSASDRKRLDDIRDIESRILAALERGRRDVLDTMVQSQTGRRMMQAYKAA